MAVVTFGVTADSVRKHHFPFIESWSATTAPTDTTVTEKISENAGLLAGALLKEAIQASSIAAASPAYVQCTRILRLMVALELVADMTGQDPKVVERWQAIITAWFERLADIGATALGDESLSTSASDPGGPTDHIDEYGLDVGDTADASSVVPRLRRDDAL